MAESFKSFNGTKATNETTEFVIIPSGINGSNTSSTGSREISSSAQAHSIYISQRTTEKLKGKYRYNPRYFSAFNLYIKNVSSNVKTYIVFDGRVVAGAPFFIEKNITLEPSQMLCLECPNDSFDYDIDDPSYNDGQGYQLNQSSNVFLDVSASVVLFPSAN